MSGTVYSQKDKEIIIGKSDQSTTAAVYNIGDPMGINIEVNLWGFVRYPGRYIVPVNTTLVDLLSYAGGPVENSNLEEIRILRPQNDTLLQKSEVIRINYDDLMFQEKVKLDTKNNPRLKPGDVVLIMQQKRYTFRDDVGFFLPILTSIITIATFIITVRNSP